VISLASGDVPEIEKLLKANAGYAPNHARMESAFPQRRIAVVTCMDARIDVFAVLGLELGDAHVLRNAGGRITDDMLRSLALSTHVLGVDTVVVMQHTKCGLAGVTDRELWAQTGAGFRFLPIDDHAAALEEDVELLTRIHFLRNVRTVAGLVFDMDTGHVEEVVRWERPTAPEPPAPA
jgi:carbonic anhydrase